MIVAAVGERSLEVPPGLVSRMIHSEHWELDQGRCDNQDQDERLRPQTPLNRACLNERHWV